MITAKLLHKTVLRFYLNDSHNIPEYVKVSLRRLDLH